MKQEKENFFSEPISRRDVLKLTGVGGLGLMLGTSGTWLASKTLLAKPQDRANIVPFHGEHQAGIITPAQDFVCFAALDIVTSKLSDIKELFRVWTDAAARMSTGQTAGDESGEALLPPTDTGEVVGLSASRLTITFGAGSTLFQKEGIDRFGIASKRPSKLIDLPLFSGDNLQSEWCGGDLCIQACADDPQVAFHAVRNLIRIGRGFVTVKWMQSGFQRTSQSDPKKGTPRNLLGFKDGTANPNVHDVQKMNQVVWSQTSDQTPWMVKGSYMVVRRVQFRVEAWDRTNLQEEESIFGRHRQSGAPLGMKGEFDKLDLEKKNPDGTYVIPEDSHVRLARGNGKAEILRRSYSYTNGLLDKTGQIDAGLLFICFQRDPKRQFVPMQTRLANSDRLNEYIVHVGSAVFACFPGAKKGGYIGGTLF
ncbi:iron uptake transporter deferrochelatase/peroxidase subunit [Shimazuella kribbensis]|uniref:iron uptake transporter deferrochelatase/peroxidase subunit n=1 Tax=Shimazuella kribbensis TaxID=139808 RepID=UPI000428C83A|nr:iron uptake transporter deferrochelatase/peroxidase subunit [Shimazuella kribbensis]